MSPAFTSAGDAWTDGAKISMQWLMPAPDAEEIPGPTTATADRLDKGELIKVVGIALSD